MVLSFDFLPRPHKYHSRFDPDSTFVYQNHKTKFRFVVLIEKICLQTKIFFFLFDFLIRKFFQTTISSNSYGPEKFFQYSNQKRRQTPTTGVF